MTSYDQKYFERQQYLKIKEFVAKMESDAMKFYAKNNRAAGKRYRKNLAELAEMANAEITLSRKKR